MPTFDETWKSIGPLWAAVNDSEGAEASGLAPSSNDGEATVFAVRTGDVEQPPQLPEGGDVVGAPLGPYDAVEVTLFGRAAARGRIAFGDSVAVVGRFDFEHGTDPDKLGPAVLSALAEEAFLEGADVIYTVVEGHQAPSYLGSGWTEAGRLARS
ncbi:hypothetical protein [Sinomonas terrae]|uniref:Uncharacterized protein n=1 Tax=Sinomonas terrae TaxID=2908838 RepID=A0ABS9U1L6_9MICC|nr:hypothetical protein [Sinomonas terrae]MCH6470528.1 hypothetical protein [Sinomonas terrae]